MINLHITLNNFQYASRILKQTASIQLAGIADTVYIAALHSESLAEDEKVSEKIHVHRFRLTTRKFNKSLPVQLLKYLEFCARVYWYYSKREIDLVNVHTLGLLPLGVLLKACCGSLLVYDAHELETEVHGLYGIRKKLSQWVEKFFVKKADQVFVVSESIADWYQQRYNTVRPVVALNVPKRAEVLSSNYFREKFGIDNSQMVFLCQGGMDYGRGIPLLLEAFKTRNDNAVIVFMGYGELEGQIKAVAAGSSSVFFHPAVPPDVVLNYTASADIGFAMVENTCLSFDFSMPNKLFEFLMAGLPVIVPPLREMKAFVEKHKFGVSIQAETVEAVNKAIEQIKGMDLQELKQNARKTAWEHAWEVQEEKMINAYKKLIRFSLQKREENSRFFMRLH